MPKPLSAYFDGYPRLKNRIEETENVVFRPLFLYLRDKHFREYLERQRRDSKPVGLHVGCAGSPIPGWYNCDLRTWSRQVNYVDATRKLPFPDATFDFVFSEHFIEHLGLEEGQAFFREALRVLKPGGTLRTATPSLTFVGELCIPERRTPAHERYVEWLCREHAPKGRPVSHATVVNHLFRGWGHRHIYDAESMTQVLRGIGFRGFKAHPPEKSDIPHLRGLEQHGKSVPREFNELETFVLEAVK